MDYSLDKRVARTPTALTPNAQASRTPRQKASPVPTTPQVKNPTPAAKSETVGKKYTEEDIQKLLSNGYISVHPALWDHIPTGAHIRYVKKDDGNKKSRAERFKPGGFVRSHFSTDEGKKMLMIETRPGGARGEPGYISFPLAYEDVDELWKKYDRYSFIEIHLIYTSLAQKKKQIEDLAARVNKLEEILRAIVRR